MRSRGFGGIVGIIVIVAYLALRLGFLAQREREDGVSPLGIVATLVGAVLVIVLVALVVQLVQRSRAAARDRVLAGMHPGALLVPLALTPDLGGGVQRAEEMLGLPRTATPRSGTATLVADGSGLAVYAGAADPHLVVRLDRTVIPHVGPGSTRVGGRYRFGRIPSIEVFVSNGQHWTTVDLAPSERVLGFARAVRGDRLDDVIRRVSAASGIALAPARP